MPTKERYVRDKAYYEAYHRSDSYRLKVKPAMKKHLRVEGKCVRCHRPLEEGAHTAGGYCINCVEYLTQYSQIRKSLF